MSDMFDLTGRVAVITGGGGVLGSTMARSLATAGVKVAVLDLRREQAETVAEALKPEMFEERYGEVFEGDENWKALPLPEEGSLYEWDPESTYVQHPPFFEGMTTELPPVEDIEDARVLALLGQSVTTDHISPAGAIPKNEPAGRYLQEKGVAEDSETETYAALRLSINNWRWKGVPFYVRSGKRLARRVSEIAVGMEINAYACAESAR